MRVVGIWADAALRLTDRDMRMMERLVRAQALSANGLSRRFRWSTPLQRAS